MNKILQNRDAKALKNTTNVVVPVSEMAASMAIPIVHLAPDPSIRAEMIAHSSSEGLEQIRQHALATMFALSEAKGILSPECAVWSNFVGTIIFDALKCSARQ
jgi:hypothetical protein